MAAPENLVLRQDENLEEEKGLLRIEGENDKAKHDESATLDEALDIVGFGKYSYLVVFTAGINILGTISPMLLMSYVIPATDCDLNLTTFEKGFLTSMMFTGSACTTHLMGILADEYGRKYISMRCNAASSVLTLLSAFCPNFASIAAITFLNGAASSGVITPAYIYVGESTPLKYRPSSILTAGALGNISNALLPAVAILLIPLTLGWDFSYLTFNSWRLLIVLTSLMPMAGVISFSMLDESPKFLLAKGFNERTLEVLQRMYSVNTGKRKSDFPVKMVRLDSVDVGQGLKERSSMKRILMQTVGLFQKPLRKSTILACNIQAGLFAAANVIYMWLPQIVNRMMIHSDGHPEYAVQFCQILETVKASTNTTNLIINDTSDSADCIVNVPANTYYVATLMGIVQLVAFLIVGLVGHRIEGKKLLVIEISLGGALIIASTLTTDLWSTVVCMMASGVIIAVGIPTATGIIIGLFPTNVRSTAACLSFFSGRLVSGIGMQIMATMQGNYCNYSYWGLGVWVIGVGLLVLFGLKSQSPPKNVNGTDVGEIGETKALPVQISNS